VFRSELYSKPSGTPLPRSRGCCGCSRRQGEKDRGFDEVELGNSTVRCADSAGHMISWSFSPGRIPTTSAAPSGPGLRQVGQPHRRDLGHEDFAAEHPGEALVDEIHALLERDPEPRHPRVGDRNLLGLRADELLEEGDDRAARADDVAVAHHGEPGRPLPAMLLAAMKSLSDTSFVAP